MTKNKKTPIKILSTILISSLALIAAGCSSSSNANDSSKSTAKTNILKKQLPSAAEVYKKAAKTEFKSFKIDSSENPTDFDTDESFGEDPETSQVIVTASIPNKVVHMKGVEGGDKFNKWYDIKNHEVYIYNQGWSKQSQADADTALSSGINEKLSSLSGNIIDLKSSTIKKLKIEEDKDNKNEYDLVYKGTDTGVYNDIINNLKKYMVADGLDDSLKGTTPVNSYISISASKKNYELSMIYYSLTYKTETGDSHDVDIFIDGFNKDNSLTIPEKVKQAAD